MSLISYQVLYLDDIIFLISYKVLYLDDIIFLISYQFRRYYILDQLASIIFRRYYILDADVQEQNFDLMTISPRYVLQWDPKISRKEKRLLNSKYDFK